MGQCHWVPSQLLGKQCLMFISWKFLVFWHEASPSFISRGQYLTAPVPRAARRSSLLRSPPLNPIFDSLASSTSQLRFVVYNHCLEMQSILSWMASAFTKASDVSSCQFHHAQLKKKKACQILNINIWKTVIDIEEHSVWLCFDSLCVAGLFLDFLCLKIKIKSLRLLYDGMIPGDGLLRKTSSWSHVLCCTQRLNILGSHQH